MGLISLLIGYAVIVPNLPKSVKATVETQPVPHAGDAADDPAIWVHPSDPSLSTIIGADKDGGLAVYDLSGRELQYLAVGEVNNVDLRDGFPLSGGEVALVAASHRTRNSIAVFRVAPDTRRLVNAAARTITTGVQPYGFCLYHSRVTGRFYAFVTSDQGDVEQWELFDDGAGRVDGRRVRSLSVGSDAEGCVADDELGHLYVAEEAVGVWKYSAEPSAGPGRSLVDRTGPGGRLAADVEGLAIAATGAGQGYLIASSQGSDRFVMYRREGSNPYVQTFALVSSGGVDEVTDTDGIEVATAPLGSAFPRGVFVAQDDQNDSGNQNFKLTPWERILAAARQPASTPAATNTLSPVPAQTATSTSRPTLTPTATPSATATPSPVEPQTARFAVIGDYGEAGPAAESVAALVQSWDPDFIITTGDNNYPDGEAGTIDDNIGQYYHAYIYPYQGNYGAGANTNLFFPSLGNHDWHTPGAEPYLDYFTLPGNERYYAFHWGPVTLFAVDSDSGEPDGNRSGSAQANWLQQALAASVTCWDLVYLHHPPYSSGAVHGSHPRLQWPYREWGADAVLAGHDHTYERILRDDFLHLVDGLGGKSIYSFGTPVTGSQVRYNDDYGALLVNADQGSITFQFINRSDQVIDTYTMNKNCP